MKLQNFSEITATKVDMPGAADCEIRWLVGKDDGAPKRIGLYLNQGAQQKFSGMISLRDKNISRIVTLSRPEESCLQQVGIAPYVRLTVLRAYHDDVITRDTAVGLGFEFEFADDPHPKKIIFTGDSGLYPAKLEKDGGVSTYIDNDGKEQPHLDDDAGNALYEQSQYSDVFKQSDLLVAHIGSIQEREFKDPKPGEESRSYYADHLGVLGTLIMIDQIDPAAAIVSEFGAEMKGFHFELVEKMAGALDDKRKDEESESTPFIIPGDLTMVYDIANGQFLCHEDQEFHRPDELCWRKACEYTIEATNVPGATRIGPAEKKERAHLFTTKEADQDQYNEVVEGYYRKLYRHKLPHHKS